MICGKFLTPDQRIELEQIVRRPSEDHGVGWRGGPIIAWQAIRSIAEGDGWSCTQVGKALYLMATRFEAGTSTIVVNVYSNLTSKRHKLVKLKYE